MTTTTLFQCYAQDFTTMPSAAGTDLTCPILGAQYDEARLKFMAAKKPPAGEAALFTVRIKGEFTEFPNPKNIEQITDEMAALFREHGLTHVGEPKVCWRAKPNDMWMNDHVDISEHRFYEDVMALKPHQVVGGEALVAFEVAADERDKLPAVEQAINEMVAQRKAARASRVA